MTNLITYNYHDTASLVRKCMTHSSKRKRSCVYTMEHEHSCAILRTPLVDSYSAILFIISMDDIRAQTWKKIRKEKL